MAIARRARLDPKVGSASKLQSSVWWSVLMAAIRASLEEVEARKLAADETLDHSKMSPRG